MPRGAQPRGEDAADFMGARRHFHPPIAATFAAVGLLLLPLAGAPSQAARQGQLAVDTHDGYEAAAGEALVQFDNARYPEAVHRALANYVDAELDTPVGRRGLRRLRSRTRDIRSLLAFFRAQPEVLFAEPNYLVRSVTTPNDPLFGSLWGLLNTGQKIGSLTGTAGADIDATSAWEVSTGGRDVVIGIIDSGIDYTHPDLAPNVWSSPGAFTVNIGGQIVHCPAGSHGFNALTRNCDPLDIEGHGTHVAGTIGAVGNNGIGVAGVNWTASIVAAKFLQDSVGTTADAIDAIDFMVQAKAAFSSIGAANIRVLNNSWGGPGISLALRNAIAEAETAGMLFVAAAGNSGVDIDVTPHYPAAYDLPSIVAVAGTNLQDRLPSTSNYGATSVDVAAPGVAVLSTVPGGGYAFASGTSMAAPHVTGAAALVLSACALETGSLKAALLSTVDVLSQLRGKVSSGGRLNVNQAVRLCSAVPLPPTGLTAAPRDGEIVLAWNPAIGATGYRVKRATVAGGPYESVTAGLTGTTYTDIGLLNGTIYFYVVTAMNGVGESVDSVEVSATPDAVVPNPPRNLKAKPGDARVNLTWLPASEADFYRVKRSTVRSGPYSAIGETAAASFADGSVINGIKYFYFVTAVNEVGESGRSNRVSATPAPVPAAPSGLTVVPGNSTGTIVLSWNPSAWATAYKVRRGTVPGGPYSVVQKVTTPAFTDSGRVSGVRYYYVVTALNASGQSEPSAEASAVAR